MKIVILGSSGMLGSSLTRYFSNDPDFIIHTVDRSGVDLFANATSHQVGDVFDRTWFEAFFQREKPDFVLNCIGVIKQNQIDSADFELVKINSLLPYFFAEYSTEFDFNIIHFSTDCVFAGSNGNYGDNDPHDASDLYGRTKSLGEVENKNVLNLRTSIIGHGIKPNLSLIDWFVSKRGKTVKGFQKAIFSGFPTIIIGEIVEKIILKESFVGGTYNVSADPISKFELLEKINKFYSLDIKVTVDQEFTIDRSLCSQKFREIYDFHPKGWDEMVAIMYNEYLQYHKD